MQTGGYGFRMDVGQAGQLVDLRAKVVESYAAEGSVGFGRGLTWGTTPGKQVAIPAASDDEFVGISIFTHAQENALVSGLAYYHDEDSVSVLRQGLIWVTVNDDVSAGDDAYVDVSNEDSGLHGNFTNVALGNLATGFKFRTSASAGNLAALEIALVGGAIVMGATDAPTTEAPSTAAPTTLAPTTEQA